jgi:hypothetical protein
LRPGAQEAFSAAGLVVAYMSASFLMSAAFTPQIFSAHSGVFGVLVGLAEDVVLEVLLPLRPVRHGAGVHALHEFVDEFLVLQVVGEDVMRHAGQHGGVGVGLDRNPPGVVAGRGIGVLRIDHTNLQPRCLARRM